MNRRIERPIAMFCIAVVLATGCRPQQAFFLHEDGDLSHYVGLATDIEVPDVESETLDEVLNSHAPLTLASKDDYEMWDLTLQEAMQHALANSKVLRSLGGRFATTGSSQRPQVGQVPQNTLENADFVQTIYDPAIQESSVGNSGAAPQGVEAALSQFDAELTSSLIIEKNDRPLNFASGGSTFAPRLDQETGAFQAQIRKTSATGTHFFVNNQTLYDHTIGSPIREFNSAWDTHIEAGFRQPLLQGAGVQYNRIAGPWAPIANDQGSAFTEVGNQAFDGVVIARINQDIELADFERGIQEFVSGVENSYWELYFAYRNLEARKSGLDSALETWRRIYALYQNGLKGGEAEQEAQAREQYFNFRAQVQTAKADLYRAENQLRYTMGLSISDGRLIRPADEPQAGPTTLDWESILYEGLGRNVHLRRQQWHVQKNELELIAAKNHLLPRLDTIGRYRWYGYGDDLINPERNGKGNFHNAWNTLTGGDFQEWQLGLQLSVPLGFRKELAQVRHHQLLLQRAKAVLQEQELELSHQLGEAMRDINTHYEVKQSHFDQRAAAEKQVRSVRTAYEIGTVTLDLLLDAQRRLADAESAYFRSLVDYNRAMMTLHLRKGTLLSYNSIHLAEGPWPEKAYFDAHYLARRRDASKYLDYGHTRPSVFSRGSFDQEGSGHILSADGVEVIEEEQTLEPTPVPEDVHANGNTTVDSIRNVSVNLPISAASPVTNALDWSALESEE